MHSGQSTLYTADRRHYTQWTEDIVHSGQYIAFREAAKKGSSLNGWTIKA